MRLTYVKQIAVRYKHKVFKATLPIYGELLLYILYTTHSIRLDNWARYNITASKIGKMRRFIREKAVIRSYSNLK